MRASSLCLVFGLVLLMAWTSEAQPHATPENCCFEFVDFKIPAQKIVSAVKTSSSCPSSAIVVRTLKTEFCVKPEEAWIKNFMEKQLKK